MKRFIGMAALVLLAASLLMLPACGGGGDGGGGKTMVGTWQTISVNGTAVPTNTAVFTFNADGTGLAVAINQPMAFTWALNGNQLTMISGGDTEVSTITWLSSSKIQLIDPEGDVLIMQK